VSGGVGLVGIGLGAMFGAYAISSQNREKSDCGATQCVSYPQGMEDYNTAQKDAIAATAALVAGGALVATGVVLWFTAPKPRAAAPSGREGGRSPLPSGPAGMRLRLAPTLGGLVLRGDL
jgi:hypothetical protein